MNKPTILIVDTQLDGHHVLWLTMVGRTLLEQGFEPVLLVNHNQAEVLRRINLLDDKLSRLVKIVPFAYSKKPSLQKYWQEVITVFQRFNSREVIFNNFDTIASAVFRLSALGIMPPQILKNKVSIIYHRPRPLDSTQSGIGNLWKRRGWQKLLDSGYFKHIWLLDQFLVAEMEQKLPGVCSFIPDPWRISLKSAQPPEISSIQGDKVYLLQYGVGDKRKGSELLLRALLKTTNQRVHVWLAGKQKEPEIISLAAKLVDRVTVIDRYIQEEEESWLFANCTWVTLPYLSHYGSSNLLSKAAKFGKPVIASDYHLLGKNVINNNLGIVFHDRSVDGLVEVLNNLDNKHEDYSLASLNSFADNYSFYAFKEALGKIFPKVT